MKISAESAEVAEAAELAPTIELNALEHPIWAVTVFSSRKAEVVRAFAVELEEGQNEINITSLPSCIETDSARITGLGDAILFDVVCTVSPYLPSFKPGLFGTSLTSPTLSALERARSVLQGEKTLRGHAADILVKYGYTMKAETTSGETVGEFLDSMLERGSRVLAEAEELDARIEEVDRAIREERERLDKERNKPPLTGSVSAVIMAKKKGSVEITLTYMVGNASWSPTYDLRAVTSSGQPPKSVSLHYRAAIQQTTGEDWRDTSISVSTATPGTWDVIPALRALSIRPANYRAQAQAQQQQPFGANNKNVFGKPATHPTATNSHAPHQQQQQPRFGQPALFGASGAFPRPQSQLFGLFGSTAAASTQGTAQPVPQEAQSSSDPSSLNNDYVNVESSEGASATGGTTGSDPNAPTDATGADNGTNKAEEGWAETKAIVTESGVSSAFHIEGNCSIPNGKTAHKVAIAILKFDAKVNYVAVPRSAPSAFLQCVVANTSEYRLLPGSVMVYLDNSPVSKSSIPDVHPEESFTCTFGPDPSIRIKCKRLPRTVSTAGSQYAAQTTVATYRLRTRIQNTHAFPIVNLVVRDAVPAPAPVTAAGETHKSQHGIKVLLKRPERLGEAAVGEVVHVGEKGDDGEEDEEGEGEGKDKDKGKGKEAARARMRWPDAAAQQVGKYEWLVDLPAGEEVTLDAEYDIRAPSDFNWVLGEEDYAE